MGQQHIRYIYHSFHSEAASPRLQIITGQSHDVLSIYENENVVPDAPLTFQVPDRQYHSSESIFPLYLLHYKFLHPE